MAQSFAATVGAWCKKIPEAKRAVFQTSCKRLVSELDQLLEEMVYSDTETDYRRTGFLKASLVASNEVMPTLSRENPGVPVASDHGDVLLVINGTELGTPLYLGYTAKYGGYVHYGAKGRAPRPWVELVAQRWQEIVQEVAKEVKSEFGL